MTTDQIRDFVWGEPYTGSSAPPHFKRDAALAFGTASALVVVAYTANGGSFSLNHPREMVLTHAVNEKLSESFDDQSADGRYDIFGLPNSDENFSGLKVTIGSRNVKGESAVITITASDNDPAVSIERAYATVGNTEYEISRIVTTDPQDVFDLIISCEDLPRSSRLPITVVVHQSDQSVNVAVDSLNTIGLSTGTRGCGLA